MFWDQLLIKVKGRIQSYF